MLPVRAIVTTWFVDLSLSNVSPKIQEFFVLRLTRNILKTAYSTQIQRSERTNANWNLIDQTFGFGGNVEGEKSVKGFGYYETIAGGSGAGKDWDGTSGVHTHMTVR